jgi:ABC-type lipoprotein release transport system permease subunit
VAALAHALVIAVRRRRRDLAIARSVGFTPADARAAVRWHAVTMAGLGMLIGVPVGLIVGRLVWRATAHSVGAVVAHTLPIWVPPLVVAAAIVVSIVVVEPMARRVGRTRPAQGLRAE